MAPTPLIQKNILYIENLFITSEGAAYELLVPNFLAKKADDNYCLWFAFSLSHYFWVVK